MQTLIKDNNLLRISIKIHNTLFNCRTDRYTTFNNLVVTKVYQHYISIVG